MRNEMRSAAIVASLGLILLAARGMAAPSPETRPVRTVTATPRSDREPVSLAGHIGACLPFRIDGQIDGQMIGYVEVGQVVQPNELIAELDPLPQRDALQSTEVVYDAAETAFSTAKAPLDVAKAQLHGAEGYFGFSEPRADAPGVVISRSAEAGELVKAGQTIVTVALYDGTDAVFDVLTSLNILASFRLFSPLNVIMVTCPFLFPCQRRAQFL
jgi:membrane fusion protein, multidrug efflux system